MKFLPIFLSLCLASCATTQHVDTIIVQPQKHPVVIHVNPPSEDSSGKIIDGIIATLKEVAKFVL